MMAAWKRPQASPAIERTLPADLLLEIVARSDTRTLVRGAATCKLLRSDILSAAFINRVTQQGGIVPPWILASLNRHDGTTVNRSPPLSLIYPATPAAVSFLDDHLPPYMPPSVDDLLGERHVVISRGNLVLLGQHNAKYYLSNLCVYDLITRRHTFLSDPFDVDKNHTLRAYMCVLLTASDGINCSFLLLIATLDSLRNIQLHTITSTSSTWAPPATIHATSGFCFLQCFAHEGIVLHGGIIHWLVRDHGVIFTYNVCTMEQGMIMFPADITSLREQLYLGSYYSHDGQKLLRFFRVDGFNILMWHQLQGGDWVPEAVTVDMEEKRRSLEPDIIITDLPMLSQFKCLGEGSSAVLLRIYRSKSVSFRRFQITIDDLETKEMHVQEFSTPPLVALEIDLLSRLRFMKIFR